MKAETEELIVAFDFVKPKKKKTYVKTGTKREGRGSYYATKKPTTDTPELLTV